MVLFRCGVNIAQNIGHRKCDAMLPFDNSNVSLTADVKSTFQPKYKYRHSA